MSNNRLIFLKGAFPGFELHFADDCSNAIIVNPNYNENIIEIGRASCRERV